VCITAAVLLGVTVVPVGAGALDDPGNSKNCDDFATWFDAQSWFETFFPSFGDVARLDADEDGIACESLPGAPEFYVPPWLRPTTTTTTTSSTTSTTVASTTPLVSVPGTTTTPAPSNTATTTSTATPATTSPTSTPSAPPASIATVAPQQCGTRGGNPVRPAPQERVDRRWLRDVVRRRFGVRLR
jgi:hypothetical protein